MVRPAFRWLVLAWALSFLCVLQAAARDYLPRDHALRYSGYEGRASVTVEVTLREQPDGTFDYVQWTLPRGWGRWFSRSSTLRTQLTYEDERLRSVKVERQGRETPAPAGLAASALDPLGVRLRARADIARGLRHAEYTVWQEDGRLETWTLEVSQAETVATPNGAYQCLRFRLGTESDWLEGWSAPLLVFHFVRLEHWREGRKVGELSLEEKQL
jgi:hypothetical protein